MDIGPEFRWDLTPTEAVALQREWASKVLLEDPPKPPELIAGVDMALGRFDSTGRAAVVVWRVPDGAVVEEVALELPLTMPYVPGLLAFREGPLVMEALRQLESEPDLIMVDGQGIAHPRRCGIGALLGVLLNRPTIGVGKTRLYGRAEGPGLAAGDRTPLLAPDGSQLGVLLRTHKRGRPLYVSPGHRITPETAGNLVMSCVRGHRLPEPIYLADKLSKTRLVLDDAALSPGESAASGHGGASSD
ncbi:MAG: endonuclease V [Actinomycetota bacterium]